MKPNLWYFVWRAIVAGFTLGLLWTVFTTSPDLTLHWYSWAFIALPLALRLLWDRYSFILGQGINHVSRQVATGTLMLLCALVVWRLEPVRYLFQPVLFAAGFYWLFFDALINLLSGRNWYYIPEPDDEYASWSDGLYYKIGWKILYGLKLFAALVAWSVMFHWSWM